MTSRTRSSSAVSIESKPATIAKSNRPLPVAKMLEVFDPGTSPFGSAHVLPFRSDVVTQPGNSPFGAQVKPNESGVITGPGTSPFGNAHDMIDALNAINAKAAQLGWAGAPLESDVQPAGSGFVRHFENADIYFSKATGAYEVNGAIRDKYNILGVAEGILGLPLTDESATPDGVGRFNHFQGGSIYWTPALGAVMIRGAIRNRWAAQGWETGPLGYPVQDEHRYATLDPARDPNTAWSLFENGAVVTSGGNTDVARTVEVSADTLRCLVRQEFDRVIHESSDSVGLHAPSETIAVSPSYPRAVTFGIHGFHNNGPLSDTDFDITVALRFGVTWEAEGFTEPETKNLAVSLVPGGSVTANGVAAGAVASGVRDGIQNAFAGPRTVGPPLAAGGNITPRTPDLIDVLVTAEGGLRVLLNPLPDFATGGIRAFGAQKAIEALGCQ